MAIKWPRNKYVIAILCMYDNVGKLTLHLLRKLGGRAGLMINVPHMRQVVLQVSKVGGCKCLIYRNSYNRMYKNR